MYLTYQEYQNWGGDLDEQSFFRFEFIASKDIDRMTFGRVKTMSIIPESVKRTMFELIPIAQNRLERKGIASETIDKWSRSYTAEEVESASSDVILRLLGDETDDNGTPLIYCGVRG